MSPQSMIATLKQYESYCYRIAYYLLEGESSAVAATKQALLELAMTPDFLVESSMLQRVRVKRVTIKAALAQQGS